MKNLNKSNNIKKLFFKAFTLVELVVVITILAILGTIGFIAYNGYLSGTRDTNRITQLTTISDGLEIFRAQRDLPIPESNVEVRANGSVVGYQGYMGRNNLSTIAYNKSGLDPKDGIYFTYYITADKKYYQLMAYLEDVGNKQLVKNNNKSSLFTSNFLPNTNASNNIDYSKRYPTVYGKKLGILTENLTNRPIQEVASVIASGYLDIVTTANKFNAYISDKDTLNGTGGVIYQANPYSNCKRLTDIGKNKVDGEYKITPYGDEVTVYCNKDFVNTNFYNYIENGDMENSVSSNWPIGGIFSITNEDKYSGEYSLKVAGGQTIISNNYTYIQPGKKYRLQGYFKLKEGSITPSNLYFGFAEYDENFVFIANNNVNAIAGTETTLANNVLSTDTKIDFDCDNTIYTKWNASLVRHSAVAFEIDDSGEYNDLPNRKLSNVLSNSYNTSVSGLLTRTSNICTLNFNPIVGYKVGKTYPAGTKIRLHNSGGSYNYIAAGNSPLSFTWTKYYGEVSGISKYGVNQSYFRRGTKFIKILVLPNYYSRLVDGVYQSWQTGATLYMDDVSMQIVN